MCAQKRVCSKIIITKMKKENDHDHDHDHDNDELKKLVICLNLWLTQQSTKSNLIVDKAHLQNAQITRFLVT